MIGKSILLCSDDLGLREKIASVLACSGRHVVHASSQPDAITTLDRGDCHLVIVDVQLRGALSLLDLALSTRPAIAITSGRDLETLSSLVCTIGVANVVALPEEADDNLSELLVTVEKLLRNDLFGLEKYVHGCEALVHQAVITEARERDSQLSALSNFLRELKAPRHTIATIANAADEMLTNAIYNAPVDSLGRPRYASTDRRTKIQLSPTEHVELNYGVRDGMFGISVSDRFGRLRLSHLSKSIERCATSEDPIEQKAGGAGLGLFLIARTAHQFVINVDPEERTEVIAVWDLDRRRLREQRAYHSLHYFERAYQLKAPARVRRAAGTRAPTGEWETPGTSPGFN